MVARDEILRALAAFRQRRQREFGIVRLLKHRIDRDAVYV